jgi:ribonuclease BN (tRNA processing enzyme)
MPDHEPALGVDNFPMEPEWTSGYTLTAGADLLVHDSQYSHEEYEDRTGWGHSTLEQALRFGQLCEVKRLVTFHYDPAHTDDHLDNLIQTGIDAARPTYEVIGGTEGTTYTID